MAHARDDQSKRGTEKESEINGTGETASQNRNNTPDHTRKPHKCVSILTVMLYEVFDVFV